MSSQGESMTGDAAEPRPGAVEVAVALMRAGAALTVVRAAVSLGGAHPEQVEQYGILVGVGALGQVALWLWMARANGAGHRWARTVATVLGGLSLLGPISAIISAIVNDSTATTVVLTVVTSVLGLSVVGLLHRPGAEPWFRDRP
jgi:hypothetical protein